MKRFFCLFLALLCVFTVSSAAWALDLTQDTGYLALVNADHPLALDKTPGEMVDISTLTPALDKAIPLRPQAAANYVAMVQALQEEGYQLIAISGYRSAQFQDELFQTRLKERQQAGMTPEEAYASVNLFTALPGTSEHQLGLAIDVSDRWSLEQTFANTPTGQWLKENCWRFGYILRYLETKSALTQIAFEPWHFRYVGQPHAAILYQQGWCLEEYVQYLHEHQEISFTDGEGKQYLVFWTEQLSEDYPFLQDFSSDNAGGYIVTLQYPEALALAMQDYRTSALYPCDWQLQ